MHLAILGNLHSVHIEVILFTLNLLHGLGPLYASVLSPADDILPVIVDRVIRIGFVIGIILHNAVILVILSPLYSSQIAVFNV